MAIYFYSQFEIVLVKIVVLQSVFVYVSFVSLFSPFSQYLEGEWKARQLPHWFLAGEDGSCSSLDLEEHTID